MAAVVSADIDSSSILAVPHVVRGRVVHGSDVIHSSRDLGTEFGTPRVDIDGVVWGRREALPALNLPVERVLDFLEELGRRLEFDQNALMREAFRNTQKVSTLGPRVLENCYRDVPALFRRRLMEAEIAGSIGDSARLDGWVDYRPSGGRNRLRAFPPRLVHVLAGNTPHVAALTIIRAALTKGVHLLKLASNDLFTPTAILATMAEMDPESPVTRSFSAAYWRGGDAAVEGLLYRPQYFDKLVVWGGESAVRNALKYVGPGFELVSFDPKVSVSMIGAEAIATAAGAEETARRAALDVTAFDQDACSASRYQFVEGEIETIDRYCEMLAAHLSADQRFGNGRALPTSEPIREEVDVLRSLDPIYRVFGSYDGSGLVVRSDEPVGFHPNFKTVNVVQVPSLEAAVDHVTVATQTVGIFPAARKTALLDALASAGAQRIVTLGGALGSGDYGGLPHDGAFPLHRFMKWIIDEGETPEGDS